MSKFLFLGFPLEIVEGLLRRRSAFGNGGIDVCPGAFDDLPSSLVEFGYARLPLRGDIANLSSQVVRRVHREVARLARLAGETIASLFLREQDRCGATNDGTDKKTGEESSASAIALIHV